jgi:hypothetical protein
MTRREEHRYLTMPAPVQRARQLIRPGGIRVITVTVKSPHTIQLNAVSRSSHLTHPVTVGLTGASSGGGVGQAADDETLQAGAHTRSLFGST